MNEIKQPKLRIWYDDKLLASAVEQSFDIDHWHHQDRVIGAAQGRGTTWFIQLAGIQAALRHYRRGGLFGKIVSDHYLFFGWKNSRAYREFQLLAKLADGEANVPKPIAARVVKRTFCYQADLLSEKIPNTDDLVSILEREPLSNILYQSIGKEIRKMHDLQVNHTDLNIHNILVDNNSVVWLIDFDKCGVKEGDSWKESNLSRLKRSFYKEKNKRDICWQESDFEQLLIGYHSEE